MTISVKHKFTSGKADGADATLVRPSNWNDEHDFTLAAGKVLGRDTSGAGAVQELPIAVTSGGNVGIGTTSPSYKLDVVGTARIGDADAATFLVNFGTSGVGTDRSAYLYGDGTNVYLSNQQNGALRFGANNAERMRITSAGRVGIGTSAPEDLLHIAGGGVVLKTAGSAYNYYVGSNSASFSGYWAVYNSSDVRIGYSNYWTGADYVAAWTDGSTPVVLGTNGSERMRVTSAGDVGIGTSSPVNKLTVTAGADTWAASFFGLSSSNSVRIGTYSGVAAIGANNNAGNAWASLSINPYGGVFLAQGGGYVGIGLSDPSAPLDISSGSSSAITGLRVRASTHATSRRAALQVGDWVLLQDASTNGAKDFGLYDASVPAFRFYVDTTGNVGFGTTTPTAYSGYKTVAFDGSSGSVLDLHQNGTRRGSFYADASSVTMGAISNLPLIFLQSAGEKARISTDGNLLVGYSYNTSATGGRFFAYESNGNAVASLHNGAQNSFGVAIQVQYTNSYFAWFNFGTTTVGSIGTNGSSTSYNTTSDYRLKTNVQPLTGSLQRVLSLEPSTYDWLTTGERGVGFIAHKLAEHIPEAVTGEKDAVDAAGNIKPQGVDLSKIVPDLVGSVQEVFAELVALRAEIATLRVTH